jgi:hypothetical protein
MSPQTISYIVSGTIIILVLALRMRRVGQRRPLKLERLWIVPAMFLAITALTFAQARPSPITLTLCAVSLMFGAALGWKRGQMMQIHVDPETHELGQVQSWAAMLFFLAIFGVRFGARALIDSGTLPVHVDPTAVTDVLITFALGMFTTMRVEMFLRARRLLEAARAGRTA